MGRELIVNRIDFVEGNKAIIRDYDDTYICGRTDFTNALSTLFYDRNVVYLIVDYDGKLDDSIKIDPVSWEDEDLSLEEFNNIDLKTVIDICNEHIKKDNMELEREHEMLDSARTARRNTNTVKDFSDFSDLIDELQKHINKYFKGYFI
jgi:hypothetical protein